MVDSDDRWKILNLSPGIELVRFRIKKLLTADMCAQLWSELDARTSGTGVVILNFEHVEIVSSAMVG